MKPLTHYVVVRRDLSVGVLLAMVAHAAGESFYRLDASTGFDPATTVAVVLGARNEGRVLKLQGALIAAGVPHVAILETDGEHAGQLMAIGLVPGEKDRLSPLVNDFHMLRELQP